MAKKTRKVSKQQSQQRAIQQAVANVQTVDATSAAPAAVEPVAPARALKVGVEEAQEFAFVKSDVRRSLTLAAIFAAVMLVLSFILR